MIRVVEERDIGDTVLCDFCNEDFTNSDATGGIVFGSKATCPKCAPGIEQDAVKYGETHMVRGRCVPGMKFADWVRKLRAGNNKVRVMTADSLDELLGG